MRTAFKEWAVAVDALGRGDQIIILRKGGIHEGSGGFQIEHPRFLLFPTLFHQQRESVLPGAQARYDVLQPALPGPDKLRIQFCAGVVAGHRIESLAQAERLRGQHIWRDEVIAERFDWGRDKRIHALAVRIFRLAREWELPMLPAYGGCKSWIELEADIPTTDATPVLSDELFAWKLKQCQDALAGQTH
ncbi:MAG TPA: DUF1802 family protein [Verrucomicrobiae bacterium]|nr:DUF1802 family protein [Verrucomicrobiae bacterium]